MHIYILGYQSEFDKRQGVYHCILENNNISIKSYYQTKQKPGAFIKLNNQLIVSTKKTNENEENNFIVYEILRDGSLKYKITIKQTYFFSYLSLSYDNNYLLAASFYEGLDAVYETNNLNHPIFLNKHLFDGGTEDPRQKVAHSHFIEMTPDEKFVFSTDLGSDFVYVYDFVDGSLIINKTLSFFMDKGTGPRLMCFSKNNKTIYLVNEIKNRIDIFEWNNEKIRKIQEIYTVKEERQKNNSTASLKLSPNEKLIAVSNRGEDNFILYEILKETGKLKKLIKIFCGKTPRDLAFINENSLLIAAQDGNKLEFYQFKNDKSKLESFVSIPSPVAILL